MPFNTKWIEAQVCTAFTTLTILIGTMSLIVVSLFFDEAKDLLKDAKKFMQARAKI